MEWSEWVERNVDLANRNAAELRAVWLETRRVTRDLRGGSVTVASLECRGKEMRQCIDQRMWLENAVTATLRN